MRELNPNYLSNRAGKAANRALLSHSRGSSLTLAGPNLSLSPTHNAQGLAAVELPLGRSTCL